MLAFVFLTISYLINGKYAAETVIPAKIICYLTAGAYNREKPYNYEIEDIPVNLCTHVIYSFVGISSKTYEIIYLDPKYDVDKKAIERFVALKKKNEKMKAMISVGGWGEGGQKYSEMCSNSTHRKTFIKSVIAFMEKHQLDGIDFDWEYPGAIDRQGKPSDKENFVTLITELRTEFDKRNLILTAAVPLTEFRVKQGYASQLVLLFDFFNVMAYDLRSTEIGSTDVHSPLFKRPFDYSVLKKHDGLQVWMKLGVPKHKLIVGIPFYGRCFILSNQNDTGLRADIKKVDGTGGPLPTSLCDTIDYYMICENVNFKNWTKKFDNIGKCAYAFNGTQWVGYDDINTIQVKMEYIKENGFGGTMIWAIDMDDFRNVCGEGKYPLLNAINTELRDVNVTVPDITKLTTTGKPNTTSLLTSSFTSTTTTSSSIATNIST